MHTPSCPSLIPLSRPLHERMLDSVTDGLRRIAAAWRERTEKRRLQRQVEAVAEMDALMLRDIGAPEWMVNRAAERRDMHEMRLFELQFSRDVGRLHGLR